MVSSLAGLSAECWAADWVPSRVVDSVAVMVAYWADKRVAWLAALTVALKAARMAENSAATKAENWADQRAASSDQRTAD